MPTSGPVFVRQPKSDGTVIISSWVNPDGSDSDMYAYDSFELSVDASIEEVFWRGGYSLKCARMGR